MVCGGLIAFCLSLVFLMSEKGWGRETWRSAELSELAQVVLWQEEIRTQLSLHKQDVRCVSAGVLVLGISLQP